jgi:hypothetical protein
MIIWNKNMDATEDWDAFYDEMHVAMSIMIQNIADNMQEAMAKIMELVKVRKNYGKIIGIRLVYWFMVIRMFIRVRIRTPADYS